MFAAASLTEVFTTLGRRFEAGHPGTRVVLSFGGSSALAQQISEGAPADVFAAADTRTMRTVVAAGLARGSPRVFGHNRLEIAVPAGNPAGVTGLPDLIRPNVKVALCAPQVPCGAAAAAAFAAAGVMPRPVTLEKDVKAVLTKVGLGEVDAGIVYHTDIRSAAGVVTGVEFPEADRAGNDYAIAVLTTGRNSGAGQVFVDYVCGPVGQQILTAAGFRAK